MSFSEAFRNEAALRNQPRVRKFASLIAQADAAKLEQMAGESMLLTQRHFGKAIRLFAPLYVSNECINNCRYCGFSRDNPILRVTLGIDHVVREAKHLAARGFRSVLLVAGEHPKFVDEGYLQECIRAIRGFIPTVAIEVGPMADHQYSQIVEAGGEGLIVYQETYNREVYEYLHTAGPKKNFDWRLDCPERAYAGGFRRIGVGALFGLSDWREEAIRLAMHLDYLFRRCWKANFTISFPRLRPHAGQDSFQPNPDHTLDDRALVQLVCAFRLCFPEVGIVLSTREPAALRDAMIPLGVTSMSAGVCTDPGGYTGQAADDLHLTVKGRRVELEPQRKSECSRATEQFGIADERSAGEVAAAVRAAGYEPVWKDWDEAILNENPAHLTTV